MSGIPRPSLHPSRPSRNSASPKRRPLHARSDSDTNELAGSNSNSNRNSKTDADFVYSQSPFPRLPSQVLKPAGQTLVYEDDSATPPFHSSQPPSRIPRWPPEAGLAARSRSPRNKGKQRAGPPLDLAAINTSLAKPQGPRSPQQHSPGEAPDRPLSPGPLSPVLRGRRGTTNLERTDSKVRSIVNAIEEASVRSESTPPTPRPSSRPQQSPSRFNSAALLVDDPIPPLPPLAPSIDEEDLPIVQSPILDPQQSRRLSLNPRDQPLSVPPNASEALHSSPLVSPEDAPRPLPGLRQFHVMRSNETLMSEMSERPRSASTPVASADALLQELIASGANVQYPRLEKPSLASMDSDSSSLRRAFPQPLNLRRKQGRSQLARARSVSDVEIPEDFVLEYDDRQSSQETTRDLPSRPANPEPPSTPPRQPLSDQSLHSHWTPGRWNSELEDTVPELNPHALRTQHSFYGERDSTESRPVSVCSTGSTNSIGFYRFLNDSKTAWAKSYYGGGSTLRNVTPPYLSTNSLGRHSSSTRRRSYSASLAPSNFSQPLSSFAEAGEGGMYTTSQSEPESDGMPEPIFIPRRRPFQRKPATIPRYTIEASSSQDVEYSDDRSESQPEPGQPEIVEQVPSPRRTYQPHRRRRDLQPQEWLQPYAPSPHLSPDRSADPRYSILRPPSLDGYGWVSPANVQLSLAILGLICPFCKLPCFASQNVCLLCESPGWMVGAFLRLPPEPALPMPDVENGPGPEVTPDVQLAYLEDPDVKQYHKARFLRRVNRAMSFTGLCVIAAVVRIECLVLWVSFRQRALTLLSLDCACHHCYALTKPRLSYDL